MKKNLQGEFVGDRNAQQSENDANFKNNALKLIQDSGENWALNSLAALKRNAIARILYYEKIYNLILDVPGVVCEFGVHWGSGISVLHNLKLMKEPFNLSREIIGFDTFEGFKGVSNNDLDAQEGDFFTTEHQYEEFLENILNYHRSISPFPGKKLFSLVKGDVRESLPKWLEENPHALIALAILDLDIYEPTKKVLELIQPRLVKGSVIAFDELNCSFFPGETTAFLESELKKSIRVYRDPLQSYCAWGVIN